MKISETTATKVQILESDRSKLPEAVLCRVVYPICNIGQLNANNRVYEREVWERVLADEAICKKMASRTLFGQAEHPAETQSDLQLTSHTIFEMWIAEDGRVYQKMDVLDTPTGRIVDTLLRAGCQVGVSTRAEGDLEDMQMEEGKTCQRVIPESYRYETTDFTADPATFNVAPIALQRNVVPALQREMESEEARPFATALLESIQKTDEGVDEAHTSVTVTTDTGDTVSVEADGEVSTTTDADGAVTVTPELPLDAGMAEPVLDVPPVEDEIPAVEPEGEELPLESKNQETDAGGLTHADVLELFQEIDPKLAKHLSTRYGTRKEVAQAGQTEGLELTDAGRAALEESEVIEGRQVVQMTGDSVGDVVFNTDDDGTFTITVKGETIATGTWSGGGTMDAKVTDVNQLIDVLGDVMFTHGNVSVEESQTYRDLIDLKVKEASIRADRDALLEEVQKRGDAGVQVRILADKLTQLQESSAAEIAGLRRILETKAREAGISKQQLEEALSTRKYEAGLCSKLHEYGSLAVRVELLAEYFDRRLATCSLQVDENSRALLEGCRSLGDVDSLVDRLIGVARRSALHSKPLSEVKVRKTEPRDPEQQRADESVGRLMKHLNG